MDFNGQNKATVPVTRNNLFFSQKAFSYQQGLAKYYMEHVMNQTVVLFRVDLQRTNINQTYMETKIGDIAFKTPVELHCTYKIGQAELKSYEPDKNLGTYQQVGPLEVNVLNSTLEDHDIDVVVGDYIGIQVSEDHMEFFVVNNDGRVNYANAQTIYGVKPYYRHIVAAKVDTTEFNGI